ncbi:2-oxoglutarate dehydrogenase E1 component [Babesia gibsoni]|uniref:2-oxoglutarate dehydrogenase E1 component n=1 Tax=Babesia gibsoni TaxID=33632 RepID=A0AAD8LHZ0_BABGI|nr:2-oxoglutarate dehydrogenase E1 component [Babesia gibsoni]
MLLKFRQELVEETLRRCVRINNRCFLRLPASFIHTSKYLASAQPAGNDSDPVFAAAAASGRGSLVSDLVASVAKDSERVALVRLAELVRAYRTHGHCKSTVDPLELPKKPPFHRFLPKDLDAKLSPSAYGLTDADLSLPLHKGLVAGHMGNCSTVGECIESLKRSYCGDFAVEFTHLPEEEQRFFVERVEAVDAFNLSREDRLHYFECIAKAVLFERFCAKAFPTIKRFGADGLESMVVALETIAQLAEGDSVESLMLAMSHRGRLNVLVNILEKPLEEMFAEFRGKTWYAKEGSEFFGDVKYHFGHSTQRRNLRLEMLHNPSHLQFVFPVVVGKSRARQATLGVEPSKVVPVVLHGDAAFSGEGVTYETVQMSRIPEYSAGGTINIVVNNQIGFTTYPGAGSSTRYTTDLGKMVESPSIHANAHNVESVVFASRLAYEYRQRFGKDAFINLVGFRRFGHNELDMPKFTNAEMYALVDKKDDVLTAYRKYLLSNGLLEEAELAEIEGRTQAFFENALKKSVEVGELPLPTQFMSYKAPAGTTGSPATGVDADKLMEMGKILNAVPEDFQMHPAIKRIFKERVKAMETGKNIDTGLAEALAYASLAMEGFRIRLAGQDSKRGTFSHRHSTVQCQKTFKSFNIFSGLKEGERIEILNSLLSETAAMGFEYGYGLEDGNILNIWEAQFGDFANVAQAVIDEFIVSGEVKWAQRSCMCLFLPHGFDGQGPDHSSARVERFLQLSDEIEDVKHLLTLSEEEHAKRVNVSIINCSKSSILFHALRRQMLRDFRKPLIAITGKKLLKLRGSYSDIKEFGPQFKFRPVIPDANCKPEAVDTLVFCSGQIYFDIVDRVEELGAANVAVTSVEQLCPFPAKEIKAELERLPKVKRLVWCQEECANAGGWSYMYPRFANLLSHLGLPLQLEYVGRSSLAAPSCGDGKTHTVEAQRILEAVIPQK